MIRRFTRNFKVSGTTRVIVPGSIHLLAAVARRSTLTNKVMPGSMHGHCFAPFRPWQPGKDRWQANKSLPFKKFTEWARIDTEGRKTWTIGRGDIVKLHELDLRPSQRRIGQALGDNGERAP